MKLLFSKIATISLAFLVLFSTFSFTVEKHFCGDFLVDVSYLGEDAACNEGENDICIIKNESCCKDEVQQIDGQEEMQKASSKKISFHQAKLYVAFYASYKLLFQNIEKQFISYKNYSPPHLIFNLQVLHETFTI